MARPIKRGIEYFPVDVGFFEDMKIRRIKKVCGNQSILVLIEILCNIYRDEGYYLGINDDVTFLIAEKFGVSEGAVLETVRKAVEVEFFDSDAFNNYSILTSKGILKRYLEATSKRKRVEVIGDFAPYLVNVPDNVVIVSDNGVNGVDNTQSKVKQSKVKYSKASVEKSAGDDALIEIHSNENHEEVKNYFESYIKMNLASMKDEIAITDALDKYPKDFILQVMEIIAKRNTQKINSFSYFTSALEDAYEAKKRGSSIKSKTSKLKGKVVMTDERMSREQLHQLINEKLKNDIEGVRK